LLEGRTVGQEPLELRPFLVELGWTFA
jgi:hypothetical protein